MKQPTHEQSYQVLLLQLADEGRQEALLGESAQLARISLLPFIVGNEFPDVYFEFPLMGAPFLDVTILYQGIEPGTRIESEAAEGSGSMIDWFSKVRAEDESVSFGFELDAHEPELPRAAVHFQPRKRTELVKPFCEAAGEPEKADLYLGFADRMPEGWDLSFFGMFRGRPGSPLRVCGYLDDEQKEACAADPAQLARAFDEVGFTAYDAPMLAQVSEVLRTAPSTCDFQFDIFPDGTLGETFSLDVQFRIERPELVRESFADGPIANVFGLFESWGMADERWRIAGGAAFARALPVELEGGEPGNFSFTLMPQWTKARWRNAKLQPSKLYYLGSTGLLS